MNILRLLLTVLGMTFTVLFSHAKPMDLPGDALAKFSFDSNLADSTGRYSLRSYNMSTGKLSQLRSPRFIGDGLLLTEHVASDVKIPNFTSSNYMNDEPLVLVLRMRLPENLEQYAPVILTKSKGDKNPLKPIVISGDSIHLYGSKTTNEEKKRWSNPLPKPDADGITTIIYIRTWLSVQLYVADRLYDYEDKVEANVRYDRIVISPAKGTILCDLAVYNRYLSKKECTQVNGFKRGFSYKYGETDREGTITEYTEDEESGYRRWIIADIIMVAITVFMFVRKGRNVVAYKFMGFPVVVLLFACSIAVHTYFYVDIHDSLKFWKWVSSLTAYLFVAWIPLSQEEYEKDKQEEEEERLHRAQAKKKSMASAVRVLVAKWAFDSFIMVVKSVEGAKRTVVTRNVATGAVVDKRKGIDFSSLLANVMSVAVSVLAYLAILVTFSFFVMRILLWILPWASVFFFVFNVANYIMINRECKNVP